jgi:hypothetical protein
MAAEALPELLKKPNLFRHCERVELGTGKFDRHATLLSCGQFRADWLD